jgi:L-asparaginase II
MTTRLAEITRAGEIESVHDGAIAVVDVSGKLVASAGDPNLFAFFRSSGKPFQAIPVVESGAADAFGFTPAELALCCASHYGEGFHQAQVSALLVKMGLDVSALQCGIPAGYLTNAFRALQSPSPLQCDCSGKHSGMLATCLHLGYPIENYLDRDHPVQVRIRETVAELCRVPVESLKLAVDGCSVPTFGTTIKAFAIAYSSLGAPEDFEPEHAAALNRLRNAMTTHPENVEGTGGFVTNLMRIAQGSIAVKTGAEGLICLAIPAAKLGIAVRIADGSFRAQPMIVASMLQQLGLATPELIDQIYELHPPKIVNHNQIHVGDIRPVFTLDAA